ncbi:MAG: carbon-nitrogen hydrolase family protein [Bacteroidetes Order II. Incertae sedis bacterium]|nr:carbon-nitrogen hydrolase family protein [Bacteroidetes Order II. bacterium]
MFKIAAAQFAPVYLNKEATVKKACSIIADAGKLDIDLLVFPEAFLPGYPAWVWHMPAGKTKDLRPPFAQLLANSVTVPGPEIRRVQEAAAAADVGLAFSVNEINGSGSGSTLYNTIVYIDRDGHLLGKHRKMIPTTGERLVWAQGDGSDLQVHDFGFAQVAGLVCWENYMPLARYTLNARGAEVHVAPTWDRGGPWVTSMQHIAKEGRCYVVGCAPRMELSDIPDSMPYKQDYLASAGTEFHPGGSVIVDPDGKIIAGPLLGEEGFLIAEAHREVIQGSRFQLDTAGHYARPDVFELIVHEKKTPFLQTEEEDPRDPVT